MPELKRNFMQGRMNKDLDERIIPDGEYRDALNIEVSTAEESSVGTARNVPGNQLLGNMRLNDRFWKGASQQATQPGSTASDPFNYYQPDNGADFATIAETVGVTTDPANDKIYSFIASVVEPYYVAAGEKSSVSPTTYNKTLQAAVTDSDTVTLDNVTNLAVGMVVVGTDVTFGSVITSISGSTVTLNKTSTLTNGITLTFSKAALVGYDVDAILETRSASYEATVQDNRLKAVFVDVYNVYRVPPATLALWDQSMGTTVNNTTGPRGEDITIIRMSEATNGGNASSSGNGNFANGIYKGAEFQLILDGVNILTPNLTNPITGNAVGSVHVQSVTRSTTTTANLGGSQTNAVIEVVLNKAIPDGLVTVANIQNGLSYKFSNERLLNFETGRTYDYTETNSAGATTIKNHPTPINTKITGIDIVDNVIYFTDGKTEPKRIDIEKGIEGSNRITMSLGEPIYNPILFETTQMGYNEPISLRFGYSPSSILWNKGFGQNNYKRKNYELEDITVIRRHPLNPPTVDLMRSRRVGLTHNIGLKAGTAITNATAMGASITFTVTKNKARDYAFPSFYTGTVGNNNLKNHSWRVDDVLSLSTIHLQSPVASAGGSDSGSRSLKVKITAIASNGTFSQPGSNNILNNYHDTDGVKIVNSYRDSEHGYYDFGDENASINPATYTKYNDILSITATVVDKNAALSSANTTTSPLTYFEASLDCDETDDDPFLFKNKFPRYAIRYKYDDNQFSAISPFTEPCFLPRTNYSWNKDEGQNNAMVNDIKQIVLRDFITPSIPVDVKQIDILVKFDGENNIYKLESINKGSREWNDDNGKFAKTVLGPNQLVTSGNANFNYQNSLSLANRYPNGSYGNTRGVFYIKSEKLGAVIPSNQILRPFDAVPTKAKAQCISANRLIYGNYSLDYDLVTNDGEEVVPRLYYEWRDPEHSLRNSFREHQISNVLDSREYGTPQKSIKGDRTYILGISFLDRFGRQSPVVTGPESAYTTSHTHSYTSSRLRAKLELSGGIPYWATDYRYYIKETSNEYYNIAMYRAYPAEGVGTNEATRTTSYWLAFHSADRNKIQEDSAIRLKSRPGGGSAGRLHGGDIYRVLDISNEAPKSDGVDAEIAVVIPAKERKGKFYVKVKANKNLIKGLKGPFGFPDTRFGGILGDTHTPAIFETMPDPDIGLNIFYEIPRTYPINLTEKNIEDYVNFGDFVGCYRSGYDQDGADAGAPTFKDSSAVDFNTPNGSGTKPNELQHFFDRKSLNVPSDLTTRVLALRGSELSGGVQKLQLDAEKNFGVPIIDYGATTIGGTSQFYLAGSFELPASLVSDGVYVGNPGVAGSHKNRASLNQFGSFHIYRLDGTKSSFNINNLKDGLPGFGQLGMGYQVSSNTTVFDNTKSYTKTNVVHLDSLVYGSENTLPFHNCWHFGNGVESDRIRDDFNAPQLDNGVKASSTSETYGEKNYKHGLIFSGIYNSKTDVNNLNQFIKAEGITKDLNPEYGSIQKLFTRNTNVLAFCENKVLKILSNKDALFNADGNTNLTSSKAVLGTAVPFSGDHGISRNPESFAEDEFRCYFTDRDRGAVCRLSMDGITAISGIGMSDYFADELKSAVACIGAFNDKKGEYDLTIHNNLGADDTDNDTTVDVTKRVQTLSFNEKTNSWVSFKSYVIEQGLSINNEYYTIKKGRVYLHSDDAASGRNNFYGTQYFSSITPIFNDAPGSVKSFQTINYEGTQAQVIANSRTGTTSGAHNATTTLTLTSIPTGLTVGQNITGNDFTLPTSFQTTPITVTAINTGTNQLTLSSAVTIATAKTVVFSDAEYYNDDAYTGWYVESITTDQQEGEVLEFKEKEGKWFNSISGVATTFTNDVGGGGGTGNIDSQEFSVQGIGSLNSISGAGNSGLFYFSKVSAQLYAACDTDGDGVDDTIVAINNIENNIPHGTNFATYSSFDHDTGKQKVSICPPSGYSFVNPQSWNGTSYTASSLTFTANPGNTTSEYSIAITQATTLTGCIDVVLSWNSGFTPNANTTVNLLVAQSFGPTVLAPIYNYQLPINIDLAWEEGGSNEWYIVQPTAVNTGLNMSAIATGLANTNNEFNPFMDTSDAVDGASGNDISCMLTGSLDQSTGTTVNTFSVIYRASGSHYFPNPQNSTSAQSILNSFLFPVTLGFPGGSNGTTNIPTNFYTPGGGAVASFGTQSMPNLWDVTWDFTQYNNNGLATELTATYTIDPFSDNPNELIDYYTLDNCSGMTQDPNEWGDPILIWLPDQDIGGGEEPVIPDGGDTPGTSDDPFDDPELPTEFTVNVNVTHQNTGGGASAGVSVQNDSFTVVQGQSLSQATAQCVISPIAGFTFSEAQIVTVDGIADTADGVYEDGVDGSLTTHVNSITCVDDGAAPNSVLIDFTFEDFTVNSDLTITIIITGTAVNLSSAEVSHRLLSQLMGLTDPSDNSIPIFGNGSSGQPMVTAAPDGNYSVTDADATVINGTRFTTKSAVLGTSSDGVQRTVATFTMKTQQGHRFITQGDMLGNVKFLYKAGTQLIAPESAGNSYDANRILAWIQHHYDQVISITSAAPELYEVEFGVTVTNYDNSNVQEQIVVTLKHTGNGLDHADSIRLFDHKVALLHATNFDNPQFS